MTIFHLIISVGRTDKVGGTLASKNGIYLINICLSTLGG